MLTTAQVIQSRGAEIEALLQRLSDVDDAMSRRGSIGVRISLRWFRIHSVELCRASPAPCAVRSLAPWPRCQL